MPCQFYTKSAWINVLRANAAGHSVPFDLKPHLIDYLYAQGIAPNVNQILAWATHDPERWEDYKELEAELADQGSVIAVYQSPLAA